MDAPRADVELCRDNGYEEARGQNALVQRRMVGKGRGKETLCFEWGKGGAVSQEFYVAGLEEHVYGCRDDYFSDITIASTTTTTTTASRTSRPTGGPDEEGSGPTTTSGAAPEPTGSPDGATYRAAPVLLAAGGLVAASACLNILIGSAMKCWSEVGGGGGYGEEGGGRLRRSGGCAFRD
ncbi:hypothetical protein VTG60DRAFT_603 [Thermothelomyces hinnuleus]